MGLAFQFWLTNEQNQTKIQPFTPKHKRRCMAEVAGRPSKAVRPAQNCQSH